MDKVYMLKQKMKIMNIPERFQVVFMARVPALTAKTFRVYVCGDEDDQNGGDPKAKRPSVQKTQVYCLKDCSRDLAAGSDKFMDVQSLPEHQVLHYR